MVRGRRDVGQSVDYGLAQIVTVPQELHKEIPGTFRELAFLNGDSAYEEAVTVWGRLVTVSRVDAVVAAVDSVETQQRFATGGDIGSRDYCD